MKILEKYSIEGVSKLNKDLSSNVWRDFIVNSNLHIYKNKKKHYLYNKKTSIIRNFKKAEYLKIFSRIHVNIE